MMRYKTITRSVVGGLVLLMAAALLGMTSRVIGAPANAPHGPIFGSAPELYVYANGVVGAASGVKTRVTVLGLGLAPNLDYDLGVAVPHSGGCCQIFWHSHSDQWGRAAFHFPLGAVPLVGDETQGGDAVTILAVRPSSNACTARGACTKGLPVVITEFVRGFAYGEEMPPGR